MKDEEIRELKKELIELSDKLIHITSGNYPPHLDYDLEALNIAYRLKELAK